MKVIYAPRALRDLQSIGAYLLERRPSGAANVFAAYQINDRCAGFFPQIGRLIDNAGHRRVPVMRYPYVILYRIAEDELFILHIRHTSRRPIDPPEVLS